MTFDKNQVSRKNFKKFYKIDKKVLTFKYPSGIIKVNKGEKPQRNGGRKMLKLYEITNNYNKVLEMMEDPEIDREVLTDTLTAIDGEFDEKIGNCSKVVASLKAEEAAIDAEIKRLQAKKQTCTNHIDWLKSYMFDQMTAVGKDKIKTDVFTVTRQKSTPSVVVDDASQIPADYFITKEPELSKQKIKDAINEGKTVNGVHLEQSYYLKIR